MPKDPGTGENLLRLGEVAEILGVSPETVRNWTASGKLAALRTPGRHRYYKRADVDAVMERIGHTQDVA